MESLELRYRRLAADGHDNKERWKPIDGSLRSAADTWLVIHDLFHHGVGDHGTLAEELATLGAEYYVNFEGTGRLSLSDAKAAVLPPPGLNALTRNAAGIVGIAFESGTEGPQGFALQMMESELANEVAEHVFAAAERSAVSELEHPLWGMGNDPEMRAAMQAFCAPGVVASWIRQGYQAAQRRYPDQGRAREAWNQAEELLHKLSGQAEPDAVLVATRHGYDATFEVVV